MALKSYSQFTAFRALTLAALRSISKSPSSVIFTIAFPLIFILVFGFIGGKGQQQIKIGMLPHEDSVVLATLLAGDNVSLSVLPDSTFLFEALAKGTVDVVVASAAANNTAQHFQLSSMKQGAPYLNTIKKSLEHAFLLSEPEVVAGLQQRLQVTESVLEGTQYRTIDFILPGQLGFSLLASSIFGTAFVFFNLRQGLVLKRFFATPIRKYNVLLAEGVARMIFQLMGALFIIGIGYFFLDFTLIHGWITLLNMLIICALGLLVFMSIGFIISGVARSEATIPPLSNIFTLPQFLLAGTFFSIESFPSWLQPISRAMPLTYLNDALRQVAYEGASLWEVRLQLLILIGWGLLGYFVASRTFKWE